MIDTSQYGHATCFNDRFVNASESVEGNPKINLNKTLRIVVY